MNETTECDATEEQINIDVVKEYMEIAYDPSAPVPRR